MYLAPNSLRDNGVWEVVGGTGKFKGLKGAGMLHIKPVSPTDRNFILEGELVPGRCPEQEPTEVGQKYLASHGWSTGKHTGIT